MAVVESMPTGATWSYAAASGGITDTSDVTLAAAPTNGRRNYLCALQVFNADPTVNTELVIKDGSTVLWRMMLPAGRVASTQFAQPTSISFPVAIRQPTAETALTAAAVTTSGEVYVNAQGYIGI